MISGAPIESGTYSDRGHGRMISSRNLPLKPLQEQSMEVMRAFGD